MQNQDEMPTPFSWMTPESAWRLIREGGNCKGTVPMHKKRSRMANQGLYNEEQMGMQVENSAKLAARINYLEGIIKELIEINRQTAHDKYGDANKAEGWYCIKILRSAIKS